MSKPNILVTGAGGQLGKLVIDQLIALTPTNRIAALVRSASQAGALNRLGVEARIGDYTDGISLDRALVGVERLLLISSNDLVARRAQHRNVIDAAKRAGVKLIAYTSLLHADRSQLGLARDHRDTEADLRDSGLPFAVLRNGWYTENYTQAIPAALAHGAFLGSAGNGRIASAARRDFAEAAAAVLLSDDGRALSGLIGRPTTPFAQTIADSLSSTAGLNPAS